MVDYDCVLCDCTRISDNHPTYLYCRRPILRGSPQEGVGTRGRRGEDTHEEVSETGSDGEEEDKRWLQTRRRSYFRRKELREKEERRLHDG